ncbi:histone chaperone napB [Aspergillus clavatus NRRL 1]|uniref:NAP family protein n=1 Tax=Aspergillus clavatus (strain ATCC 1007 / CBS 513.65 / DSM 816 / NCTC 3887 / NRRL 1 / QM 1276 / 107) TaxID=344612 RepID=A1C545_ASPCL|nr:NAP family protein [Aspergillus clavatus NRRL 1]EAW14813.1 NAP family protein [Aspergillus clavatus NRRL 1]
MSAEDGQKSLLERIEMPEIPDDVAREFSLLEQRFIRAETDRLRRSTVENRPLWEQRSKIISKVQDDFWVRVLSNAPAEIDEYIQHADAAVLGSALKDLTVERFEVDEKGQGEPRSLRFTFVFRTGDENPFFENEKVVKDFYWRKKITKTPKGKRRTWEGLVSEPVRINWKEGMDLTKGLLDAACDLAEAEKKQAGDRKKLPEFEKIAKKMEELESAAMEDNEEDEEDFPTPAGTSFFGFFGYRGNVVSAEESKEANKEDDERFEKALQGEKFDDDDEEEEDEDDDEDSFDEIEIFPDGEDVAIALAEDLWPNAHKYYGQSFEVGEDYSDFDEDELEDEEDDEEEESNSHPRKKARV